MSIIFFSVGDAGQVGEVPRRNKLVVSDGLSALTTAGFLNGSNTSGKQIYPTDVFDVLYSYTPTSGFASASAFGTGTYLVCTVSIGSGGVITLVPWVDSSNVLLPVVSGDFAVFNGTTGQIKDAGYLPSNAAKTVVVMANAAVVSGNLAKFADTSGTVADQGVAMKSVAKAAVAGGAASQSVSDAFCTSASCVIANWSDTSNAVEIETVTAGNGSFTVVSTGDPGASHINYVIYK